MDLLDELDNMAVSASYEDLEDNEDDPSKGTIRMWQERFGYSYEKAAALVGITKAVKKPSTTNQAPVLSPVQARIIYALRLDKPLSTPQDVQIAANLPRVPQVYHGSGEGGAAMFCKIDGTAKVAIENWLSTQKDHGVRPLFVPDGRAYKEISSTSIYPTLGKDATLPQFRPQDEHLLDTPQYFGPSSTQFPVWYFFYGTLASPSKLSSLLSIPGPEIPALPQASVSGGRMETWGGGKYNALVNCNFGGKVEGLAYQVLSEDHEDALRKYETNAYEVVTCSIELDGRTVAGRTFRFVGKID